MKIFGNPGILDPETFKTFGISAKNSENPIGQFGTGLKYAIAVCMRENMNFEIESGSKSYTFFPKEFEFRNKKFNKIKCLEHDKITNEKTSFELPFTTELGKNWDIWEAYREIASNCLDEGGNIGSRNETTIFISDMAVDHYEVFMNKDLDLVSSNQDCQIYKGKSEYIFYKTIRAMDYKYTGYTYNLLSTQLTEDRTFSCSYEMAKDICTLIVQSDDKKLIEFVLLHSKGYFEESLHFDWVESSVIPSKTCSQIVLANYKNKPWFQKSLVEFVISNSEKKGNIDIEEFPKEIALIRDEALKILNYMGYKIKYPIFLASYFSDGLLAKADIENKRIYLSKDLFDKGMRWVVAGILEEYIHIKHRVYDHTREMQNVLFNEIINQGIKKKALFGNKFNI